MIPHDRDEMYVFDALTMLVFLLVLFGYPSKVVVSIERVVSTPNSMPELSDATSLFVH
jgi:hypothetical protein